MTFAAANFSLSNGSFSYEKLEKSDKNKNPPPTNPIHPPATLSVEMPKAKNSDEISDGEKLCVAVYHRFLIAFGLLLFLFIAACIATAQIEWPHYTLNKLTVHGANRTSSPSISPGFDLTFTVRNPNGNVGIHYLSNSTVRVYYDSLFLGGVYLADFHQPGKNVTVLQAAIPGSDEFVDGGAETALRNEERQGKVPLKLTIQHYFKFKWGSLESSQYTATIKCDQLVLDRFNDKAKILSQACHLELQ